MEQNLLRLKAFVDTNEIEGNIFDIKTEKFSQRKFYLNKNIKFENLKYITNRFRENSDDYNLIYLIVNTGLNSFYLIDYNTGMSTEMPIPDDIGFNPSFLRLNKRYLISICGNNSDAVYIFDTYNLIWYFVGRLKSGYRSGAYALYLKAYGKVFICGGMTDKGDNSLNLEYFDMIEFEKKILDEETENSELIFETVNDLKFDFLLRKSFPMVLNFNDYKTFIICGGESLICKTDTCVIFQSDPQLIIMSNICLPNSLSEENPNTFLTNNHIYFFENDENIVKFNIDKKTFKFCN